MLQDVLERLDRAFKAFFRRVNQGKGKVGFPRFKAKNRYQSFTLKQAGWQLWGRYLYIKNAGRFKLFLSRSIEGAIKTLTIRRTSSGQWFVAFSCDNVTPKAYPGATKEIGVDVGIETFLRDSNDRTVDNPKFFRESEKLLRRRQRSLSRKAKGSSKRDRARILVAKTHEKVANQRRHLLHRVANHYVKRFKTIYVEDLNIEGMVKIDTLPKASRIVPGVCYLT